MKVVALGAAGAGRGDARRWMDTTELSRGVPDWRARGEPPAWPVDGCDQAVSTASSSSAIGSSAGTAGPASSLVAGSIP